MLAAPLQDARNAEEAGRRGWGSTYFMPASSDKAVVLLRRWLMDCAGGGPTYGPTVPLAQVLDLFLPLLACLLHLK